MRGSEDARRWGYDYSEAGPVNMALGSKMSVETCLSEDGQHRNELYSSC